MMKIVLTRFSFVALTVCCVFCYAQNPILPIFEEGFEKGPSGILAPVGAGGKGTLCYQEPGIGSSCLRLTDTGAPSDWLDWRTPCIALQETRTYDLLFSYRGHTESPFDVKAWPFDRHGQLLGGNPITIETVRQVPEKWTLFRRRILVGREAASIRISIETFNLDGTLDIDTVSLTPVVLGPEIVSDMEMPSLWKPAFPETTVYGETTIVKEGQFSLAFNIKVDHKGGEKNYPIGWPHVAWSPDPPLDWSGFGKLTFWIYAKTDMGKLPERPLAIICRQVRGHELSTLVPIRQTNEWTRVTLPLPEKTLTEVRYIEFDISESDYHHGDEVTFYIDDMRLAK